MAEDRNGTNPDSFELDTRSDAERESLGSTEKGKKPEQIRNTQKTSAGNLSPVGGKYIGNALLVQDVDTKQFSCKEHPHIKTTIIGALNKHFNNIHDMKLDGSKIKLNDGNEAKVVGQNSSINDESLQVFESDSDEVRELKIALKQKLEEQRNNTDNMEKTTTDLAVQYNLEDRARAIGRIIANPDVASYLFHLRTDRIFPPDWDEGDIVRESLFFMAAKMGVVSYFKQDVEKADPLFLPLIKKVKAAWEKHDADKLKQKEKQEIVITT